MCQWDDGKRVKISLGVWLLESRSATSLMSSWFATLEQVEKKCRYDEAIEIC